MRLCIKVGPALVNWVLNEYDVHSGQQTLVHVHLQWRARIRMWAVRWDKAEVSHGGIAWYRTVNEKQQAWCLRGPIQRLY